MDGTLCFQSAAWKALAPHRFELSFEFREGSDAQFAAMLAEVRSGSPSEATLATLSANAQRREGRNDIVATKLYATKANVADENGA